GGSPLAAAAGTPIGAVSRNTDKIDIFWAGADGAINTHFFSELKPWAEHQPFTLVPGGSPLAAAAGTPIGAVSRNTDKIDIFWAGADGAVNTHFFSELKPWAEHQPFTLVPAGSPLSTVSFAPISAVSRNTDKIDIFWAGADGAVNTHFFSELKPWAEHQPFIVVRGGSPVAALASSAVASVSRGHDKIDLFWAGPAGSVHSLWWTEADGWGLDHRTAFGLAGGGRWYPTLITLADGRVLAVGGHPASTDSRHWNNTPETYDPARDAWTIHSEVGDLDAFVQYPRMHVLPDGKVFCATPLTNEEAGVGFSLTYDPDTEETRLIAPLGDKHYLAGGIASKADTTSVLLPLRPSRNYAPSVLLCGGKEALYIDFADEHPAWNKTEARPRPLTRVLSGARFNLNAVLLPSGEVFISGGVADEGETKADASAVMAGEMYHPDSRTWDQLEDATVVRNYHSVALLMPDGAVWTAGSNKDGLPSPDSHGRDTRELRIEIYHPWYFDRQRPQLVSAPDRMTYGQEPASEITIEVGNADAISEVAVVRTASTTHAYSSDQRYVELSFSIADAQHLRVKPPPSGGVAPPGVYLIFVLDAAHVPSTGRFITIACGLDDEVSRLWRASGTADGSPEARHRTTFLAGRG
ncbi:galactose oxidase-like domain-containing protein, partial [Streptomyces sp. NPDC001530]|uniref:galactose oxidase-like domain-containing protein n=1 Tax=Streptomyces sp. NPDC001530 TaxID=3364582 RepID=UPI0036A7B412